MIQPKPVKHVRAKMAKHKASFLKQQAIEARKAFYAATQQIDAITKGGGDPEAVAAALAPYLAAARALFVRTANDEQPPISPVFAPRAYLKVDN